MTSSPRLWRAPAKVNLTLHVRGRRADGYHELESLVAFACVGDILHFSPGEPLSLIVEGPTAALAGPDADNLVLRAARGLADRVPGLRLGAFRLVKRLPVAAGLGGGSSDAAAALRALAFANDLAPDDGRVRDAARATGSDVPVCLIPVARMMRGAGEDVGPPLGMAPMPALLVNPRVAVPTPPVFAALGLQRGESAHFGPSPEFDGDDLLGALRQARNDLQPPAERLAPAVSETIGLLSDLNGVTLARMSGSGATCFALFASRRHVVEGARRLKAERPGWWVRATWLR